MSIIAKCKLALKVFILSIIGTVIADKRSKYIYYHDIHSDKRYTDMSTPAELFLQHIQIIKEEGFEIVSEITKPKGQIAIGFDDGFRGLYENFNLFIHNDIPVTLFIVVDYLNKHEYVSSPEIKKMLDSGLLTIGSHTLSHKDLILRPNNDIIDEIRASKNSLEAMFKVTINSICFPRGRFSDFVEKQCLRAGYTLLFSSIPGNACFLSHLQKRNLTQHASSKEFKSILNGSLNLFHNHYRKLHKI